MEENLYKDLEHKKIEESYVESQVQSAETVEKETKKDDKEFYDLALEYNEIDDTATEQKKQN